MHSGRPTTLLCLRFATSNLNENATRRLRCTCILRWCGEPAREGDCRESGSVGQCAITFQLILYRHWRHEDLLERVEECIEIEIGYLLGEPSPNLSRFSIRSL